MNSYSLRNDAVYTGLWTDYFNGDRVITLDVRSAGYLISTTTLFVTIVGTCVWSMVKFLVHQQLASRDRTDGTGLFFRVLYRNLGSEIGTISEIGKIWWSWKKTIPRAHRVTERAIILALPAVVNVLVFAVAGVLSSKIAGRNYESNHVLLKPNNCGLIAQSLNLTGVEQSQQTTFFAEMALNDTQAARLYAHNCYQEAPDTTQCSLFPTRSIPYDISSVDCPFGRDPAGRSLCQPAGNRAVRLTTPLLNTNTMFGINAPHETQIEIRKALTCSPIQTSSYIRVENPGFGNSTTYLELGPLVSVSNHTVVYQTHSKYDTVGYLLWSVPSGAGGIWSPIEALRVSHGDPSVSVLAGNSVAYLQRVKDPWFSANKNGTVPGTYRSDNDLSVLACIDQTQICNPGTGSNSNCTILGSWNDVFEAYGDIGLNKYQLATADRLLPILSMTSIFTSVNLQGAGAILASRRVAGLMSPGLPDNQWQLEVQDWFNTALATIQAAVVQYVNNVDKVFLGKYGTVTAADLDIPDGYFCDKQRVRNTGRYVSFSFLGLMITYCVGTSLILASWILEPALGWFRKTRSRRDVVRIADKLFQLTRKSLVAAGYSDNEWSKRLNDVPVTRGNQYFSLPVSSTDDGEKDFCPTEPERSKISQVLEGEGSSSRVDLSHNQPSAVKEPGYLHVDVEEQHETRSLMSEISQTLEHQRQRSMSSRSAVSALTEP